MSGVARVKVTGTDELARALQDAGSGLPKMQRDAIKDILGEVVDYARPRMPTRTGRARASLKSRAGDKGGTVTLGGPKAPWAPWLDFGGQGKRKGRPPARPFLKQGRYVYAALAVRQKDIDQIMSDAADALLRSSGIEVT